MADKEEMTEVPRLSLSHPASLQRIVSPEMMRMRKALKANEAELREAVREYIQRWG